MIFQHPFQVLRMAWFFYVFIKALKWNYVSTRSPTQLDSEFKSHWIRVNSDFNGVVNRGSQWMTATSVNILDRETKVLHVLMTWQPLIGPVHVVYAMVPWSLPWRKLNGWITYLRSCDQMRSGSLEQCGSDLWLNFRPESSTNDLISQCFRVLKTRIQKKVFMHSVLTKYQIRK